MGMEQELENINGMEQKRGRWGEQRRGEEKGSRGVEGGEK